MFYFIIYLSSKTLTNAVIYLVMDFLFHQSVSLTQVFSLMFALKNIYFELGPCGLRHTGCLDHSRCSNAYSAVIRWEHVPFLSVLTALLHPSISLPPFLFLLLLLTVWFGFLPQEQSSDT